MVLPRLRGRWIGAERRDGGGARLASGFRIEHRLGVPAPAPAVWAVLADIGRWPEWNPMYPKAEGVLRIGAQLALTEAASSQAPQDMTPTIIDWVPEIQILWRLSERKGLIQRLRYIEIDKLTDEACIVSNGENWSGRLAPFVGRPRRRAIRAAFEAMNEALRDRAVALWRSRGGEPTSGA